MGGDYEDEDEDENEDEDEDEDEKPWLTPRIAYKLYVHVVGPTLRVKSCSKAYGGGIPIQQHTVSTARMYTCMCSRCLLARTHTVPTNPCGPLVCASTQPASARPACAVGNSLMNMHMHSCTRVYIHKHAHAQSTHATIAMLT